MPYADPSKRREASKAAAKLWRDRFRAEDPDGYREYTRAARKKWRENLTPEKREELREYHREYRLRNQPNAGIRPRRPQLTNAEFAQSPADPRHGTIGGYNNHGCRCDRCKKANATTQAQYRRKRKERHD